MTAFLDTLAARVQGQAPLLAVRTPARFEPRTDPGSSPASDLPDLSQPAAASLPESPTAHLSPRISPPRATALLVPEPVAPEPVSRDPASPEPVGPERRVPDRVVPDVMGPPPTGAESPVTESTFDETTDPDRPFAEPIAVPPIPGSGTVVDDRPAEPTRAAESVAPQGVRPTPQPSDRTRVRPAAPVGRSTRPDPARVGPGRRPVVEVPRPQQLMAEHLLPALIRAGLVSPAGGDDVRSDPPWQPDDVQATIGVSRAPEVHVHIGRVEVNRASTPNQPTPNQPTPNQRATNQPAPGPAGRARPRLPAVDHDAYLARRRGSRDSR